MNTSTDKPDPATPTPISEGYSKCGPLDGDLYAAMLRTIADLERQRDTLAERLTQEEKDYAELLADSAGYVRELHELRERLAEADERYKHAIEIAHAWQESYVEAGNRTEAAEQALELERTQSSLDWTRLMQGDYRALYHEHQPAFDRVREVEAAHKAMAETAANMCLEIARRDDLLVKEKQARKLAEADAARYRRIRENWIDCDEIGLHGRLSVIDACIDTVLSQEPK